MSTGRPVASEDLVEAALAGRRRAMARLMSRAEAGDPECRPALAEIYAHTGRAHIVGVTGVPGCGKSTLVRALAGRLRSVGRTVGIVAVDPSSPFSGGSILGDRIRMNELAGDPGVFIRSMATRGQLGGLARATVDVVDLLDAGGYEVIFIETVGAGQDEVDIARAAHTTLVVSAPGLGDDVQAIKAGILEIADIHVVSKSDRPEANRTVTELKQMLLLALNDGGADRWHPPVVASSVQAGEGLEELAAVLESHHRQLLESGEIEKRRRQIAMTRTLKIAEDIIRGRFHRYRKGDVAEVLELVVARTLDPHTAAQRLLEQLDRGG